MKKDDCLFCKLAAGEIPSNTLYEDENCRVAMDLFPATKGHALIIPKDHYDNFYDLPEDKAVEVIKVAKKMVAHMTEKLHCEGFNIVQNNNEVANQTVMHYHMHLIPRYKDDNQSINWVQTKPTQEELETIKNTIVG